MPQSIEPWIVIFLQRQTQILVTGFALFVFFAGFYIPIPSLALEVIEKFPLSRLHTVFVLGVTPWVYSVVFVELMLLIFPSMRAASLLSNGHANPFSRVVIFLSIIITLFQSYSISELLMIRIQVPTTFQLVLPIAISLAGATAIIISLGRLIERFGIGMGLWVLIVARTIYRLVVNFSTIPDMFANGRASFRELLISGVVSILSMAIMVWLVMVRQKNGRESINTVLWPLLIAGVLSSPVLATLQTILPFSWWDFFMSHLGFSLCHGLLVLFFVSIFSIREGSTISRFTVITLGFVLFVTSYRFTALSATMQLNSLELALLSYFSVVIINNYKENQTKFKLARMFQPLNT